MAIEVSRASAATVSFTTPQEIVINKNDDSVTVWQSSHDNLNANANLQVGNTDVSVGNPVPTTTEIDAADGDNIALGNTWKKRFDQASATITYIGLAVPGTATSSALWQIKRVSVSGTVTSIDFASGSLSFNQVWDNRASLSYS